MEREGRNENREIILSCISECHRYVNTLYMVTATAKKYIKIF